MPFPRFARVRRFLFIGSIVVFVLAATVLATSYLLIRGSLAKLDGKQTVRGLGAEVLIERDANGVPTVHAANADDLYRALGFLHAQDRFFQMDLMRRQA